MTTPVETTSPELRCSSPTCPGIEPGQVIINSLCNYCTVEKIFAENRPVQPQGEGITPEPGQAYVDAQGRVALRVARPNYPWRMNSHSTIVAEGGFTPIARLVPESQPRGSVSESQLVAAVDRALEEWKRDDNAAILSWPEFVLKHLKPLIIVGASTPSVVTEADIEAARHDYMRPDPENGTPGGLVDVLRKHFLNKSTPSVSAGTGEDWKAKYEEAMRGRHGDAQTIFHNDKRIRMLEAQRDAAIARVAVVERQADTDTREMIERGKDIDTLKTALEHCKQDRDAALSMGEDWKHKFESMRIARDEMLVNHSKAIDYQGELIRERDAALSAKQQAEKERDAWKADAERFCANVEHWREKVATLERELAEAKAARGEKWFETFEQRYRESQTIIETLARRIDELEHPHA